jgi:hypothetical protein
LIDASGTIVTGAFKDEKIEGPGELKSSYAGLQYTGEFKDG